MEAAEQQVNGAPVCCHLLVAVSSGISQGRADKNSLQLCACKK